ncbi:MAG: hypothetical protein QOC82_2455 [Frankiaceae bacterium]|jgi:hypothetical protein|nr:hypothetical protein [Frankiaceae bacterium]MDQ1700364.1 hypothetical protein [Frankiaceae bacterium]
MADDQSTLWLQYLEQVNTLVALQPGEALQAIYPFMPWDWGGQQPVVGSYSYEQWSMLNVVPGAPFLNTNTSPAATSGFDRAYQTWMNTLAIGDLASDSQYLKLQQQVYAAASKVQGDLASLNNIWKNQTGGTGPTFAAWLTSNPGYSAQLTTDENALSGLQTELANYQTEIESPLQQILSDYNDADYQTGVTDPNSQKSIQVRIWGTTPVTPYTYVEAITGNNFGGDATAGSARSFSLNNSSSTYSYNEYYAEGGGGLWDDFFGFEAGGTYSHVDWTQYSDQYTVNFSFQDLATIPVLPDQWFSGASIKSFANGPYSTGFSEFESGSNNFFFGAGGALARIYTALVVAYRPTITVTVSNDFASFMQDKWTAEGGIEIGPFFFGSETSGETTSSKVSVNGSDLTIASTANWPMIIGMKSAWTVPPNIAGGA